MKKLGTKLFVIFLVANPAFAASPGPLTRRYTPGETIRYQMVGKSQSPDRISSYSAISTGMVEGDPDGSFVEDTGWSDLMVEGRQVSLDSLSLQFRQQISLDPTFDMAAHPADQSRLDRRLFAPADDLMNFYVDLQLGAKLPMLRKGGDHFYLKYGVPTKYENGQAETCIDFDVTLVKVDSKSAWLSVKHVPPRTACVTLPSVWMRTPAAGNLPNNVVQVVSKGNSVYVVTVGKEVIDVELAVDLTSGRILRGKLSDRFRLVERICQDSQGVNCHGPRKYRQERTVTIRALP